MNTPGVVPSSFTAERGRSRPRQPHITSKGALTARPHSGLIGVPLLTAQPWATRPSLHPSGIAGRRARPGSPGQRTDPGHPRVPSVSLETAPPPPLPGWIPRRVLPRHRAGRRQQAPHAIARPLRASSDSHRNRAGKQSRRHYPSHAQTHRQGARTLGRPTRHTDLNGRLLAQTQVTLQQNIITNA
jgi:hypothetical protein